MSRDDKNGTAILGGLVQDFSITPNLLVLLVLVPIITGLLSYLFEYFSSPLRKYPGPFLGRR